MAYGKLVNEIGLTQSQVASKVGRDRSTVANFLRLLLLPDYAQEDLLEGRLSMGHAKALLTVEDPEIQRELRDQIVNKALSVRQTEILARRAVKGRGLYARARKQDPDIKRLCEDLTRGLGSEVKIVQTKKGGRLEIHYRSAKELEQIIELLRAGETSYT